MTTTARAWVDEDDDIPLESSSRVPPAGLPSLQPQWIDKALEQSKKKAKRTLEKVEEEVGGSFDICTTMPLVDTSNAALAPHTLRYTRLPELTKDYPQQRVGVFSHRWNPTGTTLATVGPDRLLQLYNITGAVSKHAGEVSLGPFAAYGCRFFHRGDSLMLTGRQSGYVIVDLQTLAVRHVSAVGFQDRDISVFDCSIDSHTAAFASRACGVVFLTDTRTLRATGSIRMNEASSCVQFSNQNPYSLWVCSGDQVTLWDLRAAEKLCLAQHRDDGGVRITAFAASGNLHAVGSDVGVVNLYPNEWDRSASKALKPLGTALNLVTAVTSLAFNADTRLLSYASDAAKNQLRMLHVPSMTTYQNFPRAIQKSLGRVLSLGFSPSSGMATVGTSQGKVLAYRLAAYEL